ncbi:ABC transporter permease subunit [Demequina sp. TTPB684]|uniref:amino acid ABC transporter permease n=1 Tax=unclassified Demequina TaxID=2620311 RepID=UPI001CF2E78A|nr:MULTISPECIES: ABC transporter permease subunit [unclassified Demequina]MCB2413704.1 ABC transporter permease subunit [Demequina sp. TTPB684]UPU89623.1 ABC transporter permease subunit [Demequina sp. TMPB413]
MSAPRQVLYDVPGPKAILRDKVFTAVFTVVMVGLLALLVYSAYTRGIFDDRWQVLWDPQKGSQNAGDVWHALLVRGLLEGTLKAVVIAVPIVALTATVLVIARASGNAIMRALAYLFTHVFRGIPVLLTMYFGVLALGLSPLVSVVLGLVVYNTAVVAEILRAGIAALPRGQREAGLSLGLRPLSVLLRIQLPQAVRIMLPALVSQIVVLLKDTSLGFIIAYSELLTVTKNNYNYFGEPTTVVFVAVAFVIYIAVNMLVSRLAHWLEGRLSRTRTSAGVGDVPVAPPGGVMAAGAGANTRA